MVSEKASLEHRLRGNEAVSNGVVVGKYELVLKNESVSPSIKLSQLIFKASFRKAQAYSDLELYIDAITSCQELMNSKNSFLAKYIPFNWIDVEVYFSNIMKAYSN
ncbi:1251_t:CDS:2 [Ambispora gerdemannii]|uniref:1251_t:CDS:1 n=1 Tax=Ambispora gerdemannii TaxID=144530 RepID=A0A9N9AUF9_9GLOM|nr:1251_t:CDS:2 [Ambispora gerdemannii]